MVGVFPSGRSLTLSISDNLENENVAKHVGIVGCSAEGAALCYRTLCVEGEGAMGEHLHPEVSMHTFALGEYMQYIEAGDWEGVASLMARSAQKLATIGAEFAICPDNTIHQAYESAVRQSPIPWLHIADCVAEHAVSAGYRTIGVTGTAYLMSGPVYRTALERQGLSFRLPSATQREQINAIIFDELVKGRIREEAQDFFVDVLRDLRGQGCDAVVLGCTEIPLLMEGVETPLPTLDSTRLLARAALRAATDGAANTATR